MDEKSLLKKLGEETIFSAKGHFKSCDIRRNQITITIWACVALNIIGLFDLPSLLGRVFSAFGLFGTIGLLIWNEGEGKNYRANHKRFAEEYLALHKKIRECFLGAYCSYDEIKNLNAEVRDLDKMEKPEISGFARKWAKRAIEKNGETDNWFLN
jgi:hypothetical protein